MVKNFKIIDCSNPAIFGEAFYDRLLETGALVYGRQSVLHTGHSQEDYDKVTKHQQTILFPLLKEQLDGNQKVLVDFGCGPGRFTRDLADVIDGRSIGVDPIPSLIRKAPRGDRTEFKVIRNRKIPLDNESVDIVWICLVLGGIVRDDQIKQAASEIDRCLKPGGLLFLVENTADAKSTDYWCFRTVEQLDALFANISIKQIGEYDDLGQSIAVMTGRKRA